MAVMRIMVRSATHRARRARWSSCRSARLGLALTAPGSHGQTERHDYDYTAQRRMDEGTYGVAYPGFYSGGGGSKGRIWEFPKRGLSQGTWGGSTSSGV